MEYNCRGGPLQGQLLLRRETRGAKGVLLVDRQEGQAWIYEWDEESRTFDCRQEEPMRLVEDPNAPDNSWRAAEEYEYDVIAAPWVV